LYRSILNTKKMIKIPQRLLGEALLYSAEKNPSKTAIIVKGAEYSYIQLKDNAEKLADYLIKSGIRKGDRVAICMNNSWPTIVSVYGATIAGAVFVIINPQTKADKLGYILNDSGSKILITEIYLKKEFLKAVKYTSDITEIIYTGKSELEIKDQHIEFTCFEGVLAKHTTASDFPEIIPNDLAALIYTSGSTGFPKGVMMTHQAMVFASWSLIQYLRLSENERILLLLPLAFDYGLYQLLMSVTLGATLIVEQSFIFTASIYSQIEQFKPTVFPGVPTIYAMMIAGNKKNKIYFESIQKITNTAAALPAEYIPELKKIFPNALIFKMYGLTECKRVCYLEPELIDLKPDSVGKAIPGTEIFLLSPSGELTPKGEPGILHIRGPHLMSGYWNNEELSSKMLKEAYLPGEKILCSNDWFKMDIDGDLYFLGRNDDIIKSRGEKVSPVEIENVIYKITAIKEVAVIGIPDKILGESIVAFITTHNTDVQLNEKEVLRECAVNLENFMVPQKIVFLDEMPKNSNGKIDKLALKDFEIKNEEVSDVN
jgi:long-chain acyl-CoA synthetase